GVLLSEMVSRSAPFQKTTVADTFTSILKDEPPPLGPDVPPQFENIVTKALQKSEAERYQTAKDMALDLKQLHQSLGVDEVLRRQRPISGRTSIPRRMMDRALRLAGGV